MSDHEERARESGLPPLGEDAAPRAGGPGAGLPPLDTPPRTPPSEQPTAVREQPAATSPQAPSGTRSVDWRSGKVAVAAAAVLATAGLAAGMWIGDANADQSGATGAAAPPGMGAQGVQDGTGTATPQDGLSEDDLQQTDPSAGGWGMPGGVPDTGSAVPQTGSDGGWAAPDASSGVPPAPGVSPGAGVPDGSSGAS